MFLITLFGVGALLLAIIPTVAVAPILVYIGIVTANQVVRETPRDEVPVIFVCLFPWIGTWALTMVHNVLKAAGDTVTSVGGHAALESKGVNYLGLANLGNGAPLSSMIWGCIAIFAITDKPIRGAVAAGFGAVLAFLGFIHMPTPGLAQANAMPLVYGYLMIAGLFALKHFLNQQDEKQAVQVPASTEVAAAGAATTLRKDAV
jgi:AGZA family xanthine/uracil permease-like MFS transporter